MIREKFHLMSWNEGKDTSNCRGVGLSNELDMHAKGKLEAANDWTRPENKNCKATITIFPWSCCINLTSKQDANAAIMIFVWCTCRIK